MAKMAKMEMIGDYLCRLSRTFNRGTSENF